MGLAKQRGTRSSSGLEGSVSLLLAGRLEKCHSVLVVLMFLMFLSASISWNLMEQGGGKDDEGQLAAKQ